MSDDQLEHKVRIALRAAQMKRKIVPGILIEIHQRIDDLHEEYVGEKKEKKEGWPIFEIRYGDLDYTGMNGDYMRDYYKRHHEIASFLEGVGVPDIKVVELAELYQNLKARDVFKAKHNFDFYFHEKDRKNMGYHLVHKSLGTVYHYECGHYDEDLEQDSRWNSPDLEDLKSTPWFHNQHPTFNTMNYKAKLFLICLEVGDLLETESPRLLPP